MVFIILLIYKFMATFCIANQALSIYLSRTMLPCMGDNISNVTQWCYHVTGSWYCKSSKMVTYLVMSLIDITMFLCKIVLYTQGFLKTFPSIDIVKIPNYIGNLDKTNICVKGCKITKEPWLKLYTMHFKC